MSLVTVLALGMGLAQPAPAADYWNLRAHFQRQHTEAACSVASIATALGALTATDVSPQALVAGDARWADQTRSGGEGVSFAELQLYLRRSLETVGLTDAEVEVFRPRDAGAETLARLRRLLAAAGTGQGDVVLVTFDQGWLLGEPAVGHVSPVGGFDAASGRVLIMDVDPAHPDPYWVRDVDLLAAMTRPDSDDPTGDGVLVVRMLRP